MSNNLTPEERVELFHEVKKLLEATEVLNEALKKDAEPKTEVIIEEDKKNEP